MNVDKYGFPIFDEDYDNPEIHIEGGAVIKETSVKEVELTVDLKQQETPKEKKKLELLF